MLGFLMKKFKAFGAKGNFLGFLCIKEKICRFCCDLLHMKFLTLNESFAGLLCFETKFQFYPRLEMKMFVIFYVVI